MRLLTLLCLLCLKPQEFWCAGAPFLAPPLRELTA